jgi:DNA-binding XRE family transcriptional regulator
MLVSQRINKAINSSDGTAQNRVKEFRLELGLTRVALAKMADLSEKTLDRLEGGSPQLRETTYRKVFNALNRARTQESLSTLKYEELFSGQTAAKEHD